MPADVPVPFAFDQQQRNTLNVSGLAGYVQRPPRDRVGWVHVRQVWLPGWRPAKWAYEVQHLEVTLDSYEARERLAAEPSETEPWEVLMLTRHSAFLTDDLTTVEAFFARFMDRPEYARHPATVGCPHDYANEKLSEESPARWSLIRRAYAARLLCLHAQGITVCWDAPTERLHGRITEVGFNSLVLTTKTGTHRKWFFERSDARLYHLEDDGYVRHLWDEPTPRMALDPEDLPVWDEGLSQWVFLSGAESLSG